MHVEYSYHTLVVAENLIQKSKKFPNCPLQWVLLLLTILDLSQPCHFGSGH